MTTEVEEFLRNNPSKRKISAYRQFELEIAELAEHGASLKEIVKFLADVKKIDANQSGLWAFLDRELRRRGGSNPRLDVARRFAASLSSDQKENSNIAYDLGLPSSQGPDAPPKKLDTAESQLIRNQPHVQVATTSDRIETEARRIRPDFDRLQLDAQAEILAQIRVSASKMSRSSNRGKTYKDVLSDLKNSES